MTITADEIKTFSDAVHIASKALNEAKTADDVRKVWKDHYGYLGHRALGRLLIGSMTAETMIEKREG